MYVFQGQCLFSCITLSLTTKHHLHWSSSPTELQTWKPGFPFAQLSFHALSRLASPEESKKARMKHSSSIIKPQAFHSYTQSSLQDHSKHQKPRRVPHGSDHPSPGRALGIYFRHSQALLCVRHHARWTEWIEQAQVLTLMKGPCCTEDR